MGATTHSIEINAPLHAVYNQWTQFEEFPRFMEGVEEVRQDGPRNLFWTARIAGKEKRWEAEILEQIPDHKIVWQSIDGTPNSGEVTFEPLDQERTRVILKMEYEPEGFLEKAGDALGIPSGRAEGDLKRFRDFIEEKGTETGSWNGRIEPGENQCFNSPSPQADRRSSLATESTSTVTPGLEMAHFPTVVPINPGEAQDSPTQQVAERSSKPTEEPLPAATELLGAPDEPQFYRDATSTAAPTHEEIAQRAHELYLERGQAPGYEMENWLQAEKELSGKLGDTHSGSGT
jgi:uncharacterized protein YndB with AHSA1/START domain